MLTAKGMTQFIYGGFSPIAFLWVFFMVPEFKGRSLEQLDEMFEAKVPTRDFQKYQCVTAIHGEGGEQDVVDDLEKGKIEHEERRASVPK